MAASKKKIDRGAVMRQNGYIPASEVAAKLGMRSDTPAEWFRDGKVEGTMLFHKVYLSVRSLVKHIGEDKARMFGIIPSTKKKEAEE